MSKSLVIQGTRPPSGMSSRPSSGRARRSRAGYKTVSHSSPVDETLFSSHHSTHPGESTFKSPWCQTPKEKKKCRPLLWSPTPASSLDSGHNSLLIESIRQSHNNSFNSAKYQFRLTNHTPTFVDESLFGPRLEEPSFDAPWNRKKKTKQTLLWSPVDYSKKQETHDRGSVRAGDFYVNKRAPSQQGPRPIDQDLDSIGMDGRPPSRQSQRPASLRARPCTVDSSDIKPVWKP